MYLESKKHIIYLDGFLLNFNVSKSVFVKKMIFLRPCNNYFNKELLVEKFFRLINESEAEDLLSKLELFMV